LQHCGHFAERAFEGRQKFEMNYSKWDKFLSEQSDSDTEEPKPSVKTVADGQSIKIGPKGYEIAEKSVTAPSSSKVSPAALALQQSASEGEEKLMVSGSRGYNYFWRQDRQEVLLTVILPQDTKGKDLSITYDTADKRLVVLSSSGEAILNDVLKHGINTENMVPAEAANKHTLRVDAADWEVRTVPQQLSYSPTSSSSTTRETTTLQGTQGTRVLELVLHKVSPLPGAVFWWSACFTSEADIDVTKIAGRKPVGSGGSGAEGKSQEQRLAEDPYVLAQRMFAEKMRSGERVAVELDD
jgi:hypothetical protein